MRNWLCSDNSPFVGQPACAGVREQLSSYDYDPQGTVTDFYVNGTVYFYQFDAMERPTALIDANRLVWAENATYNAAGPLTGATFGSYGLGVTQWTEATTYNSMLQPQHIKQINSSNSGVLMDMTHNYPSGQNNSQV